MARTVRPGEVFGLGGAPAASQTLYLPSIVLLGLGVVYYVTSPALFACCSCTLIISCQPLISLNVNIVAGKVRLRFSHDRQQTVWDHLQVVFLTHMFSCVRGVEGSIVSDT